jgi:multidrug efflux pump
VRHQGKEVVALGVSMAKGGDIIALGKSLKAWTQTSKRTCPQASDAGAGAGPAGGVATSVNEFVRVLIEAVVIVLAVSFIAWACTSGQACTRWWRAITSTCARVWWWASPFRWCWR